MAVAVAIGIGVLGWELTRQRVGDSALRVVHEPRQIQRVTHEPDLRFHRMAGSTSAMPFQEIIRLQNQAQTRRANAVIDSFSGFNPNFNQFFSGGSERAPYPLIAEGTHPDLIDAMSRSISKQYALRRAGGFNATLFPARNNLFHDAATRSGHNF